MVKLHRRREFVADLPKPERASEAVIARCRTEIEGGVKRIVRALLVPWLRWRYRLAELGEGFQWQRGERLAVAPGSRIGRFAYLGSGFEANGPIVVGDLCMIAAGCKIVGADHLYDQLGTPTRLAFPERARPITTFGADVWIGQRVTIVEGLTIGTGAVIGSGAIVTKDVHSHAVMVGVPARVIRHRFADAERDAHDRTVLAAGKATVNPHQAVDMNSLV